MKQTPDRLHQDAKGRLTKLTAGVAKRQTPLHPSVAFQTSRPPRALAKPHAKAQRPFRSGVGGFDAVRHQKHPQRGHLPLQASRQATGIIFARMVATNPGAKPGIPGVPLPTRRRRFGHVAHPLQLFERPRPTGRQLPIAFFGQAAGGANEMRQTGLAPVHPVLIHPVPVTDQEARPILDQGKKGLFGAVGMHQEQRRRLGGHAPEPLQGVVAKPRGFIDVAHGGGARHPGHGLIMGQDGVRGPIEHLLDGAQTDGQVPDGVAGGLHDAP